MRIRRAALLAAAAVMTCATVYFEWLVSAPEWRPMAAARRAPRAGPPAAPLSAAERQVTHEKSMRGIGGEDFDGGGAGHHCRIEGPADGTLPEARPFAGCGAPVFSVLSADGAALEVACPPGVAATYALNVPKAAKSVGQRLAGARAVPADGRVPLNASSRTAVVRCGGDLNYHAFAWRREAVSAERRRVAGALYRPGATPPDIVVVHLDTTSRASFMRQFKRTVRAAERLQRAGAADVFQFFRYGLVGASTHQNVPQLAGSGIPPSANGLWNDPVQCYRDVDFLQELLAAKGYVTAGVRWDRPSGPDASFDHALNWWDLVGRDAPNGEAGAGGRYDPLRPDMRQHCAGGRLPMVQSLEWLEAFRAAYPDSPTYAYAHVLDGHTATQATAAFADQALALLLLGPNARNTVAVLVGDHGLGYSPFAATPAGSREYRMPLLAVVAGRDAIADDAHRQQLRDKRDAIVAAFDVHHTVQMLPDAFMRSPPPPRPRAWCRRGHAPPAGDALQLPFRAGVSPGNRTCEDAAVPAALCMCAAYEPYEGADADALTADLLRRALDSRNANVGDEAGVCAGALAASAFEAVSLETFVEQVVGNKRVRGDRYFRLLLRARAETSKAGARPRLEATFRAAAAAGGTAGSAPEVLVVKRQDTWGGETCVPHEKVRRPDLCLCKRDHAFSRSV